MKQQENIKALVINVNAGYAEDVIAIAREEGATGATILNARGEGAKHEVFMGITVDSEKEIILCLVDAKTCEKIMMAIKEKAGIDTPTHGVCFSMAVERMVGLHAQATTENREE